MLRRPQMYGKQLLEVRGLSLLFSVITGSLHIGLLIWRHENISLWRPTPLLNTLSCVPFLDSE